jgi:hypothetical protein
MGRRCRLQESGQRNRRQEGQGVCQRLAEIRLPQTFHGQIRPLESLGLNTHIAQLWTESFEHTNIMIAIWSLRRKN